jgi:hypothetical protein
MSDIKSAIMLVHIVGLALGLGGAWIIDLFLTKYLVKNKITLEKVQFVEYASKIVCYGLALLWLSGAGFIAYYYNFTPEYLSNEKVWAKAFIVLILTINGVFVHLYVLPIIRRCIGGSVLLMVSPSVAHKLTTICVISVLSWLFPLLLGVSKSLNFSVSALEILTVYIAVILISLMVGHFLVTFILKRIPVKTPAEVLELMIESDLNSAEVIQQNFKKLTGNTALLSDIQALLSFRKPSAPTENDSASPASFPSMISSS